MGSIVTLLGRTHLKAKMMVWWSIIVLLFSQVFGNEYILVEQPVHHGYDSTSGIHVSGHMGPIRIIPIAAGSYQHHTPAYHVAPVYHVEEPVHHVAPAPVYHVEEPVHHVTASPVVPAPVYHVEEPVHHVVPAPVYHVEEPVHHVASAPVYHVQPPVAPVIVAPQPPVAPIAPVIVAPNYNPPMVHPVVPAPVHTVHPSDVTEHVEVEDADAENDHDKRQGHSSGFVPIVHSDSYDDPVPSYLHGQTEYVEQVNDYSLV